MNLTWQKTSQLLAFLFSWHLCYSAPNQAPKITVVIVIDQFAYHYFPKLQKNFNYGFKKLLDNGIVYTNAIHPHGIPETTTGHNSLSTGCYPKDHGGVTNQWLDQQGNKVRFETDPDPIVAKSDHHAMVDNLSDQFLQFTTPSTPTKVFALSIKSYPAIAIAGKMGKALWFDEQQGCFASSKKYFDDIPLWVREFNKSINTQYTGYTWQPCFKLDAPEYNYPYIRNYKFAGANESYVNNSASTLTEKPTSPFSFLIRTPIANKMLLDLAKKCVNKNLDTQTNDRMLLWVSLSQLDLLTHLFGPDSLESTDTIYHLDRQLNDFITFLHRKVGASNCLLVLTADHGIAPIPEIQRLKGFTSARRIMANTIIKAMNEEIEKTFKISDIVKAFEPNSFWLNHERLSSLDSKTQNAVLIALRDFLKKYPGIKDAWTYQELATKNVRLNQFASFYKTQLFPGRTGEILCQPAPYCQITHYATGTSHCTPYDCDTHVPLIFYQPGKLNHKIIEEKICIQQIPCTLARLLHITKPSASPFNILPGF